MKKLLPFYAFAMMIDPDVFDDVMGRNNTPAAPSAQKCPECGDDFVGGYMFCSSECSNNFKLKSKERNDIIAKKMRENKKRTRL